jgi:UDP-N-acetylmuramoylalanine--D-glutamate ligase
MRVDEKTVVVAGFGVTGQAVVEFLKRLNCRIIVSEMKPEFHFGDLPAQFPGVHFEFGAHKTETFLKADVIILSPGIPDSIPPLQEARRRNIPILSEIELAFHYIRGTLIGITGTNGKSTTTELTGLMMREGGKRCYIAGNIGTPLIRFCPESRPEDFYVIEISSFQLETIQEFRPHIAALINLAEDHLDRYPSVEPYYQAKMRIFENQKESDFAVLNYDDPYIREQARNIRANIFWFSRHGIPPSGLYAHEGLIRSISGASIVNYALGRLKGIHNLENTLCAASIGMLCGVLPKAMQKAIEKYQALPHRMELIAEKWGVRFYDDSKATNVDAVVKSLQSFDGNVILIMGGKDKGCNYLVLRDLIRDKVKLLLLIGEAKERIAKELAGVVSTEFETTLEAAVKHAFRDANSGDTVLLSPACSSFDMFKDYKERGEVFSAAVAGLKEHGKNS